eukprot:TRINITY_DN80583_c0_g1_i1.p2 TRINITY_DN80583_c0_g1~~TRINITY_DN80583_c0_g1_i1.p2  ORF type:complete len:246 (+),score=37.14 TRINITY_DN80583_c0_g1_i1:27-740(+)
MDTKNKCTSGQNNPAWPVALSAVEPEKVTKFFYDVSTDSWTQQNTYVKLDPCCFTSGTARFVFHMLDLSQPPDRQHMVCKLAKGNNVGPATVLLAVKMQLLSRIYAAAFNEVAEEHVDFLPCFALSCQERKGQPYFVVEPFLPGTYIKHSNNCGYTSDRDVPQAFSHFSHHKSDGKLLVCDIQGVEDIYTDPQVHSLDERFGNGDLGSLGMHHFFETHKCNKICQQLGLPQNNCNIA